MRIFIGLSEIANSIHNYGEGLRKLGIPTFTVVGRRAWQYPDSTYDVVIEEDLGTAPSGNAPVAILQRLVWRVRYYLILLRAILSCDVFIFTFGSAFRADRREYWLLKKLGKRIVSVFLGSEVRYSYAYIQECEHLGIDADIRPLLDEGLKDRPDDYLAVKLKTVRQAEEYSDLIIGLPDAGQLQSRPYMRLNLPIDLSEIEFRVPDREIPVIVHAPSHRALKGTDAVVDTIERLRAEGVQFEFRLIERLSNKKLLEVLRDADIVVDQLYSETVATLALEGMASGNAVLARYLPERTRISADCPVINVNAETLPVRLREVILDRALRRRLAEAGRPYVERYHSTEVVAQQILDWLDPTRRGEFHFHPTFFRDHFKASSAVVQDEAERLAKEPEYLRAASLSDFRGVRFEEQSERVPQLDAAMRRVRRRPLTSER